MNVHALKTWPEAFQDVWDRRKTFEIRWNDCGFALGDLVILQEFVPVAGEYTGREIIARIVHLEIGTWGLPATLAVFGIDIIA